MKIVIDCFKLIKGHGKSAGIYNLALNLVRNLVAQIDESDVLIVLGNEHNRTDFDIQGIVFETVDKYNPLKRLDCVIWELFIAPFYAKKLGGDVIVFPRGFCALFHPIKDIVIIHDMIPFYYDENYPGFFNRVENAYIMNRLKNSAKTVGKVITISQASKDAIKKYSNVSGEQVVVINNGCNKLAEVAASADRLKERYIVAITSGLPHKNAYGILRSYEEYSKIASEPYGLKVIGITRDVFDGINVKSDNPISGDILDKVDFLGFIKEDAVLHQTISDATVFLFLSLVEGFGFPPIEAMQLGVPVVCSNISSLPEVVGDAAVLVNPLDYKEVAQHIDLLIKDDDMRQALIKAGFDNVHRFDWADIAHEYLNVIKDI